MPTVLRLLGALSLLLLTGCAVDGPPAPCAQDDDCRNGQLCQTGTCFDRCGTTADCTSGRGCQQGLCVPLQTCNETRTCPAGTVCEANLCQIQQPECARDSECPPGLRCRDGACLLAPGACVTRDDCRSGERCVDNACEIAPPLVDAGPDVGEDPDTEPPPDTTVPDVAVEVDATPPPDVDAPDTTPDVPDTTLPDGDADTVPDVDPDTSDDAPDLPIVPACVSPTDCPPGEVCTDGTCGPAPECFTAADCLVGQLCTDGDCVLDPDYDPCDGRGDGRLGQTCAGAAACCNGLCLGNPRTGVGRCTDVCDTWRDCNPVGTGITDQFCYRATGLPEPLCAQSDFRVTCTGGSGCLGQNCLSTTQGGRSTCTWTCRNAGDCPSGSACMGFPAGGGTAYVCTPIGEGPCNGNGRLCFGTYCLTSDIDSSVNYCTSSCRTTFDCPEGWDCRDAGGGLSVCERL